eukprot:gene17282-22818_t
MSSNDHVWNDRNAIMFYQEAREKVLRNLEYKELPSWRKTYDENKSNPIKLLNELLKSEDKRIGKQSQGTKKLLTGKKSLNKLQLKKKLVTFESVNNNNNIVNKAQPKDQIDIVSGSILSDSKLADQSGDFALFDLDIDLSDSLLTKDNMTIEDKSLEESIVLSASVWKVNSIDNDHSKSNLEHDGALLSSETWQKIQDDITLRKEQEEKERQKNTDSLKLLREQINTNINVSSDKMSQETDDQREKRLLAEKLAQERDMERRKRELEEQEMQKKLSELNGGMETLDDEDWLK